MISCGNCVDTGHDLQQGMEVDGREVGGRGSCQTLVGQRIMTLPALLLLPLRAVALKEI